MYEGWNPFVGLQNPSSWLLHDTASSQRVDRKCGPSCHTDDERG